MAVTCLDNSTLNFTILTWRTWNPRGSSYGMNKIWRFYSFIQERKSCEELLCCICMRGRFRLFHSHICLCGDLLLILSTSSLSFKFKANSLTMKIIDYTDSYCSQFLLGREYKLWFCCYSRNRLSNKATA